MKLEWKDFDINGEIISAYITIIEKGDQNLLNNLYFDWLKLNKSLRAISTRGINIPETITENVYCLFFPDNVRVAKLRSGRCSFDCINTKTGKTVQVKAASISPDLTSFGPNSEYEELVFLDFSKEDGSFKIYDIPIDLIKKTKVNQTQTFEEQQAQGRRPRLSIINNIIIPLKLKPTKICKL
jgi:hypothetical protein